MKKYIFNRLNFKILIGFIILAVAICFTNYFIGLKKYKNTIQEVYNTNAYTIANIAASYVDGNKIAEYLKTNTIDDDYNEMAQRINTLRANSQADYIFISVPNEDGYLTYIFDAVSANPDIPRNYINDTDPMNKAFKDIVLEIYNTGKKSDNYFISKSAYGENTSAIIPIFNDKNEVTALLDVDIPMSLVKSSIRDYLINAVVTSSLIIILIIVIYLNFLRINVVAPIKIIAESAKNFVQSGNKLSGELPNIRTNDEIQLLAEALIKMQIDIQNYINNLSKINADKERFATVLNVATEIQASMLSCILPSFPKRNDLDIYALIYPAKEISGDFYDFFLIDDNHLCVVIADVTGKGVPAALFMVITKTLIKDNAISGKSPAQVFNSVNIQLCENNEANMAVTAFMAILEMSTGKLTYVNAGNNAPLIRKQNGSFEKIKINSEPAFAVINNTVYNQNDTILKSGDILFMHTSGVSKVRNINNEAYDDTKLLNMMNNINDSDIKTIIESTSKDIFNFSNTSEHSDDITLLGLTYKG